VPILRAIGEPPLAPPPAPTATQARLRGAFVGVAAGDRPAIMTSVFGE
jgi:hypothetical protein